MVYFVLFFAVDRYRFRRYCREAVYFVPLIGAEAIHMEDIVDFEGRWEFESVVHITYDFSDFKWTQLLGAELCRLLVYLDLLSLQPDLISDCKSDSSGSFSSSRLHARFA